LYAVGRYQRLDIICVINNAQVASALGMEAICIVPGRIGASFDQLALNREMLLTEWRSTEGSILKKKSITKK
jgi:hypothetical protein